MENKPIDGTSDLFCYDFDQSCRWRNLDSLLIDELDWFRGTGYLDSNRLKLAGAKATLVSDVITCQLGPGELRFMYWISPEVRLTVCLKRTSRPYPSFDLCTTPIRGGSPGPAHINIADLERQPFQIFIQADNFVFRSANLEGGFAIIDNIEYYGDLCSDAAMLPSVQFYQISLIILPYKMRHPSRLGLLIKMMFHSQNAGIDYFPEIIFARSVDNGKREGVLIQRDENPGATSSTAKSACDVLQCTFNESSSCSMDLTNSMWTIAHGDTKNTGILGDASSLPYNPEGSFAYIAGPVAIARLQTSSFQATDDFNFVFAYHKASNSSSKFRVFAKIQNQPQETIIFTIAVEVKDLSDGEYIGIDEFMVLDSKKRPACLS
ncbi:unnamed protein product [Gongylonema pulchrum]|uniref:MAM domain-containing protein n=1 Tax=Gongylonema pulchrum TaxID=637853 RepID=A0A183DUR7_9BILA|nr:unnamed protein product [Gongylonema pulchrum]